MVVYNDVLNLREHGHEVFLLANSHNAGADAATMERICPTQYFYQRKKPRWLQVVGNVGRRLPYSVARYVNRQMAAAARQIIARHDIDVVLAEDVAMAAYGPLLREELGVPFFVRGHNVDTQVFERFVTSQRNPVLRLLGGWQKRKMQAYEGSILAAADGFSMITEQDADQIRRLFRGLEPAVVGAGTDLRRFQFSDQPREPLTIMHVGSLTEFTKLEPMLWFAREVLPMVRQRHPDARLELVGKTPSDAFAPLDGVTVVGRVPDERPYLQRGRVFIAAQFVGSGVRLKILNAMATGNAIVCTPVACEGLPLVDGEHALVREAADDFADAVTLLLENDALAGKLGRNARRLVEEKYDWAGIVAGLEELLQQVVDKRRGPSGA